MIYRYIYITTSCQYEQISLWKDSLLVPSEGNANLDLQSLNNLSDPFHVPLVK